MSVDKIKRQFSCKKPCSNCPFINDGNDIPLMKGRREGIIMGLINRETPSFPCHKTTTSNDDGDGYDPVNVGQCAGAIAVVKKLGESVLIVNIAEHYNYIEPDHYNEALSLTIEPTELDLELMGVEPKNIKDLAL